MAPLSAPGSDDSWSSFQQTALSWGWQLYSQLLPLLWLIFSVSATSEQTRLSVSARDRVLTELRVCPRILLHSLWTLAFIALKVKVISSCNYKLVKENKCVYIPLTTVVSSSQPAPLRPQVAWCRQGIRGFADDGGWRWGRQMVGMWNHTYEFLHIPSRSSTLRAQIFPSTLL